MSFPLTIKQSKKPSWLGDGQVAGGCYLLFLPSTRLVLLLFTSNAVVLKVSAVWCGPLQGHGLPRPLVMSISRDPYVAAAPTAPWLGACEDRSQNVLQCFIRCIILFVEARYHTCHVAAPPTSHTLSEFCFSFHEQGKANSRAAWRTFRCLPKFVIRTSALLYMLLYHRVSYLGVV